MKQNLAGWWAALPSDQKRQVKALVVIGVIALIGIIVYSVALRAGITKPAVDTTGPISKPAPHKAKPVQPDKPRATKKVAAEIKLPPRIKPSFSGGLPTMPLRPTRKGTLTGMVVIIDPGHGGTDPGCGWLVSWPKNGQTVSVRSYEAAVTYPAAWQLAETLADRGAVVFLTAYDPVSRLRDVKASELPLPRKARFLSDGAAVQGGMFGQRFAQIKRATVYMGKHHLNHVAWVSVHVDSLGGNVAGAHVVCWPEKLALGQPIAAALEKEDIATPGRSLWVRTKRMGVIGPPRNQLRLRSLIEMGVPANDGGDSWRLRDASSRQKVMDCIATGLEVVNR